MGCTSWYALLQGNVEEDPVMAHLNLLEAELFLPEVV